jgi:hypothetical protein
MIDTKPVVGVEAVEATLDRYKDSLSGRPEEKMVVEDIVRDAKQYAHRARFAESAQVWVAALLSIMIEDVESED